MPKTPAPVAPARPHSFYVYALVDPRTDGAFYIGKGTGRRAQSHRLEARRVDPAGNQRKLGVIRELHAVGLEPLVEYLAADLSEEEALRRERAEIAARRADLTNLARGARSERDRYRDWAIAFRDKLMPLEEWIARRQPNQAEIAMARKLYAEVDRMALEGWVSRYRIGADGVLIPIE